MKRLIILYMTVLILTGTAAMTFSGYAAEPSGGPVAEVRFTSYSTLSYSTAQDFEKDLKDGTIYNKLIGEGQPIRIGIPVYKLSSTVKADGKKVPLQEILCNYRLINYIYDKGISMGYYPNYTVDEALTESFKHTKENAMKIKMIDGHKVYVEKTTQGLDDYYLYSWAEHDCLFELDLPQKMGLSYGFSLCKVTESDASSSTVDNVSVKGNKKKIIKKVKEGDNQL